MYHRENRTRGNSGKKYAKKSFGDKPAMHQTICSECDQECEVPFKPNGLKPVFCRNCFKSKEGDSSPRKFLGKESTVKNFGERRFAPKTSHEITSEQFKILNSKLDEILRVVADLSK